MSDISVMTEISKTSGIPAPVARFVLHWGEMGAAWGVNRSVAQIHALLYLSDAPLTAEDIAEQLALARSNVSNSLKELGGWNLVRRTHVLGDRRDFYEAEADMFEMVRRIVQGRKARELDPAIDVLRACLADAKSDSSISSAAKKRLAAMLEFSEAVDKGFNEIIRLPPATLLKLLKIGGGLARFVSGPLRRS
jgi:DNA-binding transcriptional regulator GbsR (MarR family)